MTTENPFSDWQVGRLDSAQPMPLNILVQAAVQAAIGGTVDDQITEHGENLFESLHERGPDAERYLANQPLSDDTPSLNTMHRAIAAAVASGKDGVALALADATPDQVSGATRYLFALACLSSGYPKDRTEELMSAFCSGVR